MAKPTHIIKEKTQQKQYTIEQAIDFVKTTAKTKFAGSVEVHINLDIDQKQGSIRFTTVLPNGSGKERKVAVVTTANVPEADLVIKEDDIAKIESGELKPKVHFDVLISEPKFMPKLAKVAKILGPAGLMPNPKNGTVSEDVTKAVLESKKGKVEIRTEPNAPIIHTIIGKTTFEAPKLVENFNAIIYNLKQNKPAKAKPQWIKSVFISSTMGPSAGVVISF